MKPICEKGPDLLEQYLLERQENLSSCQPCILVPELSTAADNAETEKQLAELMQIYELTGSPCPNLFQNFLLLPRYDECQKLCEIALQIGQIPIHADLRFKTSLGLFSKNNLRQFQKPGLSFPELVALAPDSREARQCLNSVKDKNAEKRLIQKVQMQLKSQASYLINLVGYWQMLGVLIAFELAQNSQKESINKIIQERIQYTLVNSVPECLHHRLAQEVDLSMSLYKLFYNFRNELGQKLSLIARKEINLNLEDNRDTLFLDCLADNFSSSWESGPLNIEERPSQKEQYEDFSHWIYVLKQQSFRERKSKVKKTSSVLSQGGSKAKRNTEQEPLEQNMEGYRTCCDERLKKRESWTERVFKILSEIGQTGENREHWYEYIGKLSSNKKSYLEQLYWREGLPYKTLGERTPKRVSPIILRSGHIEWFEETQTAIG